MCQEEAKNFFLHHQTEQAARIISIVLIKQSSLEEVEEFYETKKKP